MAKYNLEDIENKLKKSESWEEIAKSYSVKVSAVKRAYFRLKKKKEEIKPSDIIPPKISDLATIIPKPRKTSPRKQYQLVTEGMVEDMIRDTIKGEISIDSEDIIRLRKGCGKKPYGGTAKGSGGWNSIIYVIRDIIVKSKRIFILKKDREVI